MRQSAWLKRLYGMLRAGWSLGQAAIFLHTRFVDPNRLKKLYKPGRRYAPRHVGLQDLR